ncbi:MAG TPA: glutamate-1-semialdehyde 2,1-aminomutase [Spirochaetia bacterium]|nr:glutamate-1-semialdehyde 2,1-aminomutase [Spirochaetia bacterium]
MTTTLKLDKSRAYFAEASQLLPGGVDSPVRAFKSVGGDPLFIERGEGPWLFDVDGNRYVDYVLSWGPLVLGHAHPAVVDAIRAAAERGTSFGAPSPLEIELARRVQALFPSVEVMRFVNSGTEAVMSALRLARAFTGRDRVVKFSGGYHGHADLLLVQAGSGAATLGLPDSPGVPRPVTADTLSCGYNDLGGVRSIFAANAGKIAAVIVEPVAGNMGVVLPEPEFLPGLREITRADGAVLVFDEVMTGFRVHPGGAQAKYGVVPDLTVLGKVIGGGLPVGAYGGRRDIMKLVAPSGPMYQAGTLSGNPLAMSAGIATLKELGAPGAWERLEQRTAELAQGLSEAARSAGVPLQVAQAGSMFGAFFSSRPVRDWESAKGADTGRFTRWFWKMLEQGVYLAPSQFEAGFVSTAHGPAEIEATLKAARAALAAIA